MTFQTISREIWYFYYKIAKIMPGKPAPVPKSARVEPEHLH